MHRLLAVLVLALGIGAAGPAGGFDLQGHRGARGLAPENTLAAFARALTIGVTTLELDVGVTADGVGVTPPVHRRHRVGAAGAGRNGWSYGASSA